MRYRFGAFELDAARFELRREGALVPIQRRAFDLLRYLVEHHDVVVTREELLARVWSGVAVTKDSLAQAIMAVRHALGDDVDEPAFVQTVRGRGYRFVGKLVAIDERTPVAPPAPRAPSRLVGRDAELATLATKLADAAGGRGGVVFVTGETGTGKTALVEELCASSTGIRSIVVRCYGGEGAPDLWPFVQVLRALPEATGLAESGSLDTASSRFRVFDAIVRTLLTAAEASPLLLVLDDLHLADARSLGLLELLSSQLRSARLLVVGAYGPGTPRHPGFTASIAVVTREVRASVVRLEGLRRDDVAHWVEQTTGKRPSPELVEKLYDKTKGNPRFLSQLAHVLRAEERLRANEAATSVLAGGDAMREAITQHLAELAPSTERVLAVAAVFGRTFRLAPLAGALGETNDSVLGELDAAERARVVRRSGGASYAFVVPLVRDVLYRRLSASERARLHANAARALEDHLGASDDHERVAEIAGHLVEAAAAGDVERAADLSLRAAELAVAAGAHEAAAKYASRGLDAFRFAQKLDAERQQRLARFAKR